MQSALLELCIFLSKKALISNESSAVFMKSWKNASGNKITSSQSQFFAFR